MTDVILSNQDVTVLGGPASIKVDVDFGPPGERGSKIFVGNGNPNEITIGQTPKIFDLFINLLTSDPEYLYMYQYQNIGSSSQWEPTLKLIPNTYSTNVSKGFIDGLAQINIPLVNVTPLENVANLTSENLNVQHNVLGTNPISSSISIGDIVEIDDLKTLPITINAIEYVDNAWSPLSGTKIVHLFITVV
jgi:hypothetical protein